ncbi:MAG: hypothetical protein MI919_23600, partial [Holophagales bacterium]|nr:hypothetical protein [Holophagales bacterium]
MTAPSRIDPETVIRNHYRAIASEVGSGHELEIELSGFVHFQPEELEGTAWLSVVTPLEDRQLDLRPSLSDLSRPSGKLSASWNEYVQPPYFETAEFAEVGLMSIADAVGEIVAGDPERGTVRSLTSFRVDVRYHDYTRDYLALALWFQTGDAVQSTYTLIDTVIPALTPALGWLTSPTEVIPIADENNNSGQGVFGQSCRRWEYYADEGTPYSGAIQPPIPKKPLAPQVFTHSSGNKALVTPRLHCKCDDQCDGESRMEAIPGSGRCERSAESTFWNCHVVSPLPAEMGARGFGYDPMGIKGGFSWACAFKVCRFCACGDITVGLTGGIEIRGANVEGQVGYTTAPKDAIPFGDNYFQRCEACRRKNLPISIRVKLDEGQQETLVIEVVGPQSAPIVHVFEGPPGGGWVDYDEHLTLDEKTPYGIRPLEEDSPCNFVTGIAPAEPFEVEIDCTCPAEEEGRGQGKGAGSCGNGDDDGGDSSGTHLVGVQMEADFWEDALPGSS